MDQLICASLPHTHYWYEVGMLKVPIMCFVFSSHSFWTSSSLDVPAGVTKEEGHTGFLIHLIPNINTVIPGSTNYNVDNNSIIEPYRNRGLGI